MIVVTWIVPAMLICQYRKVTSSYMSRLEAHT